jgi:DNA-binding response OmpR family regulator
MVDDRESMLKLLAKGKKVLLVDDDAVILDIFKKVLSKYFKLIKTASDGAEAWEMYRKEKFDLVISDIEMPKTNGIMLAKGIRARNPEQVVLISSAYTEERYLVELLNIGVDGFLKKPVSLENLSSTILRVLKAIQLKQDKQRMVFQKYANAFANKNQEVKKSRFQQELEVKEEEKIKYNVQAFMTKVQMEDPESFDHFQSQKADMMESLNELGDYYDTMSFKGFTDEDSFESFRDNLHKVYNIFYGFNNLQKESAEIYRLASILDETNISELEEYQIEAFDILEFLVTDIKQFVVDMFIDQSVEDVNYFHDSLKENITLFHNTLTHVEEENEDDLEFF